MVQSKTARTSGSRITPPQKKPSNNMDLSSSIHSSIAWTLTAPSQESVEKLENASHDFGTMKIGINAVKAKIGNSVTSVSLTSKLDTLNRIIEKYGP